MLRDENCLGFQLLVPSNVKYDRGRVLNVLLQKFYFAKITFKRRELR
jgi:hypothetical protein